MTDTPPAWAIEKARETFLDAKWMAGDAVKSRVKEGAFDSDPHLIAIARAIVEADKAATERERERAAKIAEIDCRTVLAKRCGFEPLAHKHALRIAAAIRGAENE